MIMSSKIMNNTAVTIDGILPTLLTDFNWDIPPQTITEEVVVLSDNVTRHIPISEVAEFTLTMKGRLNPYSSDPQNLMDTMGLRQRYAYWDIVNDCVIHSSEVYDVSDEETGMLGCPRVPIELRQIDADNTTMIDNAGYDAIAYKFKATGNDFELFRFHAYDTALAEVTSIKLECWTDSLGEPDAKVLGSNTVTFDTTGLIPADTADWVTIDTLGAGEANDLLASNLLTVGGTYWMVLLTNDVDELEITGSTGTNLNGSDFLRSNDTGITWVVVDNSLLNGTFIVQMFQTYGGHTVEVKSYNQESDKYTGYRMRGVTLKVLGPVYEPGKGVSVKIKGYANDVDTIRS